MATTSPPPSPTTFSSPLIPRRRPSSPHRPAIPPPPSRRPPGIDSSAVLLPRPRPAKRKLSIRRQSFNPTPLALLLTLALLFIAPVDAVLYLRCCLVTERPFIYQVSNGGYDGATMEYYRSLRDHSNTSDETVGLKCVNTTSKPGPETFVPFSGFSNLVDHFAECAPRPASGDPNTNTSSCKCDIGAISAARNTDRNSKVDFVAPMFFDSIAIVQRSSTLSSSGNTLFFLKPFSMAVWLGLAGLIFLHIFATLFDRNFAPPSRADAPPPSLTGLARLRHILLKTNLLRRARYAFFATAFGMVGHSNESADTPGKPRPTTRQRFLALLAIVLGTFLMLTYESGLVLQLFLAEPLSAFRDINDLKNCRLRAKNVCVPAGGNEAEFWNAAIAPERETAKCPDRDPTWTYDSTGRDAYSAGVDEVASDNGACDYFMAGRATVETAAKTDYCGKLSVVGKDFSPIALGYILPKNSSYTAPLSAVTLDLQRTDAIEDPISFAVSSPCIVRTDAQLTWFQLGSFFYVAYTFLGIVMLFLCGGNVLAFRTERVRDFTDAEVGGEVDVELEYKEKKVKRKWRGSSAKGRRWARRKSDDVYADGESLDDGAASNSTSDREKISITDLSAVGSATTVDANARSITDLSAVGSATAADANAGI